MSKYRAHVPVRHTGVTHQLAIQGSRTSSPYRGHAPVYHTGVTHQFTIQGSRTSLPYRGHAPVYHTGVTHQFTIQGSRTSLPYRGHAPVYHTGVTHQFTIQGSRTSSPYRGHAPFSWHGSRINSKRGFLTSCSGYRQYTGVMNIWPYKIVTISCQSDITYTVSTINCACMCNHVRDDITFYQASRYPHNHNVNLILHQTVLKPYRVSYAILFCMTKHTHKLKDIFFCLWTDSQRQRS